VPVRFPVHVDILQQLPYARIISGGGDDSTKIRMVKLLVLEYNIRPKLFPF